MSEFNGSPALKPGETIEYVPFAERGKAAGARVVYRLRAPLLYDRVQLDAAVTRHGGKEHSPVSLLAALRADCAQAENFPEVLRQEVLALIDGHREALLGFYARVRAGEFDLEAEAGQQAFMAALSEAEAGAFQLAGIEYQARQWDGRYAAACAEDATYQQIYAIEAARLFLVGWEGLASTFARGRQGVPDELLMQIPPGHLGEIATEVRRLLRPSEAEAKNSAGPSSGASAGKPSTARSKRRKKAPSKGPAA